MSIGLYTHTTRGAGTVLTALIYNADHQNHITNFTPSMGGGLSDTVGQMKQTADPGGSGSESLAASLAGELERLRYCLKRLAYTNEWYEAPNTLKMLVMTQAAYDSLNPPEANTLYVIVG